MNQSEFVDLNGINSKIWTHAATSHVSHTESVHGGGILFYHDVGEISDLSQSEALNLLMWRVRVM